MYDGRWGKVQQRDHLGFNIYQLSTASHGGIVLPAASNRYVPEEMRRQDGHYEEDCDALAIVETFMLYNRVSHRTLVHQSLQRYAAKSFREWIEIFRIILDYLEDLYERIEDLDAKLWSPSTTQAYLRVATVSGVRRLIALHRTRRLRGDVFDSEGVLRLVDVSHKEAFTLLVACARWRLLSSGDPFPVFLDTKYHPAHAYAVFNVAVPVS